MRFIRLVFASPLFLAGSICMMVAIIIAGERNVRSFSDGLDDVIAKLKSLNEKGKNTEG